MRCCKVLAVYFGERRNIYNSPVNQEDCLQLLLQSISKEMELDCGVDMDLIIVNNENCYRKGNNFLNAIDGLKIKRGIIRVVTRENIGVSFGSFSYAFDMFKTEYDYFLFCEDDIIFIQDDYYKKCIEQFETDRDNLGFIALAPISEDNTHSGGGFGCSKTDVLNKVCEHNQGVLPYNNINDSTIHLHESAEVRFTNIFLELGYKIKNLDLVSPYCSNWEKNKGHIYYRNLRNNDNQNYIYKVGE